MDKRRKKRSISRLTLHFVKRLKTLKWNYEFMIMGPERIPVDLGRKY